MPRPTDKPSRAATSTPTMRAVYDALVARYGPQNWWPGETPFEVIVGALLTQNTSWKNVEKAIANLRAADALTPEAMYELAPEELAELLRPAGYFRVKTGRVRNFLRFLHDRYDGSLETMFATDLATLREELLAINGIGPETADSILLYAGQKPTFVVDTYTHRVLKRHGWVEPEAAYDDVQDHFHGQLERDVALYNDFHAQLVRVGKEHCGPRPQCAGCPLEALLPPGGALDPSFE